MKLRIQDNAIRLRLNRREVTEFQTAGRVEAFVGFPGDRRLTYVLESVTAIEIDAAFDRDRIRIRVPEAIASEWTGTDQVGIRHRQILADGRELEIVIEKDFQCMHKEVATQDPDAFPNPLLPRDAHQAPTDIAGRIERANDN